MRVCKNTRWVSRKRNRTESQTIGEGEKQQISSSKMKGSLENSRESAHSRENRVIEFPSLFSFHVHWLSFLYMLTMSCTRRFECALRLPQLLHSTRDEILKLFSEICFPSHIHSLDEKITTTKVRSWVLAPARLCHTHEISSWTTYVKLWEQMITIFFWMFPTDFSLTHITKKLPSHRNLIWRACYSTSNTNQSGKASDEGNFPNFPNFLLMTALTSSSPSSSCVSASSRKIKSLVFPLQIPPPVPDPAYCVILAKMLL